MHRDFLPLCRKVGAGAFVAPTHSCSSVGSLFAAGQPLGLQLCAFAQIPLQLFQLLGQESVSTMMESLASLVGHPLHQGWSQKWPGPQPVLVSSTVRLWYLVFLRLPPLPISMHLSLPSVYPVDVTFQHGSEDNSFAQTVQPALQFCKFKSL